MVTLMKKKKSKLIAHQVINLEIEALKLLKRSLNNNFEKAVNAIVNCQSKSFFVELAKVA